jgi:hypothetical protein
VTKHVTDSANMFGPTPGEMEEEERQMEIEKEKSRQRAIRREKAQTLTIQSSLVRGKKGYGIGIADTDGQCLVHRLVRVEYDETHPDDNLARTDGATIGPLKLGDRIVKVNGEPTLTYQEVVDAVKSNPQLVHLTVKRDANLPEQKEWLRDRIYNRSKTQYYSLVTLLYTILLIVAAGIGYAIYLHNTHEPPRSPFLHYDEL